MGQWAINEFDSFWLPQNSGCDGKAILHTNAQKIPYHQQFRFRPPVDMKGPLTFRCLIKYGLAFPSLDGSFYWPNEQDLVLSQALGIPDKDGEDSHSPSTFAAGWIVGKPGDSCERTCQGQVSPSMPHCHAKQHVNAHALTTLADTFPIFSPTLHGCASTAPSFMGTGYDWEETGLVSNIVLNSCPHKEPTCEDAKEGVSRFCYCTDQEITADDGHNETGIPSSGTGRRDGLSLLSRSAQNLLICFALISTSQASSSTISRTQSKVLLLRFALYGLCVQCLFLAFPAFAHNWINLPSRASKASLTSPCPTRRPGSSAHLQVGPGQPFPVEWAAGHTGYSYFVVVEQKDEDKLQFHNDDLLVKYLDNAPAEQASYMSQHKKYRVYSGKFNYDMSSFGDLLYPVGTFSGAEINRPAVFPFRFGSTADAAIYTFSEDGDHQSTTKRAAYHNDEYPW